MNLYSCLILGTLFKLYRCLVSKTAVIDLAPSPVPLNAEDIDRNRANESRSNTDNFLAKSEIRTARN